MSRFHGRATAQNFHDFVQNLEICMQKLKKLLTLTSFIIFSLWFTHIMWFLVWFLHFYVRKISVLKFLTAQKNLLLECLSTCITWMEQMTTNAPPKDIYTVRKKRKITQQLFFQCFIKWSPMALLVMKYYQQQTKFYIDNQIVFVLANVS